MMHSRRWLPRLGQCHSALAHGPASSAWDMLRRGGREEPSAPRCQHLVRGMCGQQSHVVGSQGHQACMPSVPAWKSRTLPPRMALPASQGHVFSLLPPCISARSSGTHTHG